MNTLTHSFDTCLITNVKFSAQLRVGRVTRRAVQQDNSSLHPQIFSKVIFSII